MIGAFQAIPLAGQCRVWLAPEAERQSLFATDESRVEAGTERGKVIHIGQMRCTSYRFSGLMVMIFVSHTKGSRFDPGLNHFLRRL